MGEDLGRCAQTCADVRRYAEITHLEPVDGVIVRCLEGSELLLMCRRLLDLTLRELRLELLHLRVARLLERLPALLEALAHRHERLQYARRRCEKG